VVDTVLKVLIQVAVGSFLLFICIWFGRLVYTSYRTSDTPTEIRPFEVTGEAAGVEKKGLFLARMLSARLHHLENELKLAGAYFAEGQDSSSNITATDLERLSGRFDVPGEVIEPIDLKVSVANVEVGPLLGWLLSLQGNSHALKLTVDYGKNSVSVFGALGTSDGEQIYLKTTNGEDVDLVDQIAYSIAQRSYSKGVPETGNAVLEPNVFGEFLSFYIDAAKLIHRSRTVGVDVKPQDYETLFNRAVKLTEGPLSKWRWLLHITGYLAESSGQSDEALLYYDRELSLLSESKADSDKLRRERIEQRIASIRKQALPALLGVVTASPAEATRRITDLIGVTGVGQPTSTPIIGIVGGRPLDGTLPDGRLTVLPSRSTVRHSESPNGYDLRKYTSDIIHAAEIVAPNANFVVAQLPTETGSFSNAELLQGLDLVSESVSKGQRLDALIFTFGPLLDPALQDFLAKLVDLGIPMIVTAGNDSQLKPPFDGDPRQADFAIAASAALDRKPTEFTTRGPGVLWLPGADIPLSQGDKFVLRNGGSFAAALLGGIVAHIKVLHEAMKPADLVKLLAKTAAPSVPPNGEVRMVNLSAALESAAQRK
jgi:hypothetical protein